MTEGEKHHASGTNAAPQHRKGHRRQESMYAMTGLYAESGGGEGDDVAGPSTPPHPSHPPREAHKCHSRNPSAGICDSTPPHPSHPPREAHKCHSRNPSAGICDRDRDREREKPRQLYPEILDIPHDARDCGILSWRPLFIQQFSSIKVFVFFLSFLVTLQQALSSGYINSVITTIEKRFEIPSSLSGLIASSYEIGNVITVIFVSYLGSRRHIPVWIAVVITTIEKRFEIPSSLSGLIASSYEIGNVITVIFVSYLGSRRHIPVWIAVGEYNVDFIITSGDHLLLEVRVSIGLCRWRFRAFNDVCNAYSFVGTKILSQTALSIAWLPFKNLPTPSIFSSLKDNSVITTIEKRFEIPSSLSGLIASSYEIGNVITVIFVSYLGSRRHIPVWIAVDNSVITTIEKRFEIPSSLSGLIASSYEIGNVITVIFVSYLGSRRHIPVWIAVGEYNID
ncbi:organic anion transporter polypeptide (OATP) family domain-containing protein [Phthorimaea operculella]|nr:organic anion transporter polypeptide (OATP) family domain-containing protein [Phthorimaea operculella]